MIDINPSLSSSMNDNDCRNREAVSAVVDKVSTYVCNIFDIFLVIVEDIRSYVFNNLFMFYKKNLK